MDFEFNNPSGVTANLDVQACERREGEGEGGREREMERGREKEKEEGGEREGFARAAVITRKLMHSPQ